MRETDAAFPGAEPRDAAGEPTLWCVRIVDAIDRRPIAGALVQVPWHREEGVPEPETHFQCAGRADDDGWVRLPWVAVQGWRDYVFADAVGYAANEYCSPGDSVCILQRGVDVPVQVVDYMGRAVPSARVELVLGCGHVPSQRTAFTDAHGHAVLPAIQPSRHEDLFVTAKDCILGGYRLRRTWRTGDPPVVIDVVPGTSVSGRVVDTNGRPIAGMRLGASNQARWTRTDRDGRFTLTGIAHWQTIAFVPPEPTGLPRGQFVAPPAAQPRLLVLGQQEPSVQVRVHAHGPADEPAAGVRVTLVRKSDGLVVTARADDDGMVELAAPAGAYRLLADGELGRWGRTEVALDVDASAVPTQSLSLPRNPTVRVDASRVQDLTLGITTADAFLQLYPAAVDGKDVPVPQEPATFRISTRADGELPVRHVPVPAPGSALVLEGFPETRVLAHFVDPDGAAIAGTLVVQRRLGPQDLGWEAPHEPFSSAVASTLLTGTVTWIAMPADAALAPLHGDLVLKGGGGEVDLGALTFAKPRAPDLTVQFPAGIDSATVQVAQVGRNGFLWSRIDEQGLASGLSAATTGDQVTISTGEPNALPMHFPAPGPPPWNVV
ncbi:MAG: hypothetical protein IPK26_03445 [Planctomycetes bacterium]|nr:hypothetical protein [Planctomycetota bacterium]